MNVKQYVENNYEQTAAGTEIKAVEVQFAGRTVLAHTKTELVRKVKAIKDAMTPYQRRRLCS